MIFIWKLFILYIYGLNLIKASPEIIRREYSLDMDKLDRLYLQTSITVLLKAKAKKELTNLPRVEAIIFDRCAADSNLVTKLANCVYRLIRERQRLKSFEIEMSFKGDLNSTSGGFIQDVNQPKLNIRPIKWSDRKYEETKKMIENRNFKAKYRLMERYANIPSKRFNFNIEKNRRKIRKVRSSQPKCKKMENIENLQKIREYFQVVNECISYLRKLGQSNSEFLFSNFQLPVAYNYEKFNVDSPTSHLEQFVKNLEDSELSFLSPKIMSLTGLGESSKHSIFSPEIFSFQDQGLIPLPRLLSLISTDKCELLEWIDLLITMTGASERLRQILNNFEPHLQFFRDEIQPKVKKLNEINADWDRLKHTLSKEQRESIDKYGYASMNEKQIELVYKDRTDDEETREFLKRLKDDKNDMLLEQFIEELAENDHKKYRRKRQTRLLSPSAFYTTIGKGSVINNNILSPQAFVVSLFRPRLIGSDIIEARAFVASIFSPHMLLIRLLYPSAFRLTLFTPHALEAYIMVPEAFLLNVLSPKILSSRVLSPDAFTVTVLSPSALTSKIISPRAFAFKVLSPSILSANFLSRDVLSMEVLSPSFLEINDGSKNNKLFRGSGDKWLAKQLKNQMG